MSKNTREQLIVEKISETGFMSVAELARQLYTSPSSIRRDLTALEQKKIVTRTHGGAVLTHSTREVSPFDTRRAMNIKEKKQACKNAAFLLRDAMSVMLDGSSTALQMLPYISQFKDIKLFTNSIYTFQGAINLGIEAYCLGGGTSAKDPGTLSGSICEQAVRNIYTDILFFSSKCVSDTGEISDPNDCENSLRKIMLERAKIRVFIYDTTKLGRSSLHRLCNIADVDYAFSENS